MVGKDSRMQEALWAIGCALLAGVAAVALTPTLRVPPLLRTNYAGREVPTAGGVCLLLAFALTVAVAVAWNPTRNWYFAPTALSLALGFGLLGLFDDVVGTHAARGWRGHLGALRDGQLTSGLLKLVGGVTIAWIVAYPFANTLGGRLVCVVIVAGCANAANLLDLAPARTTKVATLVIVLVAVLRGGLYAGHPTTWFAAGAIGLAPFELREQLMLGDTGANALGAMVGYELLFTSPSLRLVIAAIVIAVNVAGELVSFSAVIERVAPLRGLDRLGRAKR
jgi:UDP-N-acetylmuramyl pentapeptide phosphotransferase/UDP-N-acetylglucosamine-1-phosphate transferase